VILEYYSKVIH